MVISFTGPFTEDVTGYSIRIKTRKQLYFNESIAFTNVSYFNSTTLHPYRNYSVDVAMLFFENEIGNFYSEKKFQTLQDRKYLYLLSV